MTTIKIIGIETIDALAGRVEGADAKLLARATNREMNREKTAVRRAMVRASGAPYSRVMRGTKTFPATPGSLEYSIVSEDEPTSLADYSARETRAGVTAAPWRVRRTFGGSFMMGGRMQERVTLDLGGHVYMRTGKERFPIVKMWGPILPREMLREDGAPLQAWHDGVGRLQERVLREVARQIEAGVE